MARDPATRIVHASAVAVDGRALLIQGAAGAGKSSLALALMALGADLVADDRVCLGSDADGAILSAPEGIRGLVEARGLGLLRANPVTSARLAAVLDLDRTETERLPPQRSTDVFGPPVPYLYRVVAPSFPAALIQFLKAGRLPT